MTDTPTTEDPTPKPEPASKPPRSGFNISAERQTAVLGLFWRLCRFLPIRIAGRIGAGLLGFLGPLTIRNAKIERNLRLAFPDMPKRDIRRTAKGVWRNFGRVLAEFPYIAKIFRAGPEKSPFIYEMPPETEAIIESKQPIVFLTAHIGNWEYAALSMRLRGLPMTVVYSTLKSGPIDDAIKAEREGMECGLVAKSAGIRPLVAALRKGSSVGFVIDRRINGGVPVQLFDRETFFSPAPARLAIKFGCPILMGFVTRLPDGRHLARLNPPIFPGKEDEVDVEAETAALTQKIASGIEAEVRVRPQDWLCSQRVWPYDHAIDAPKRATFALDA